jgi:hypothetical protein
VQLTLRSFSFFLTTELYFNFFETVTYDGD